MDDFALGQSICSWVDCATRSSSITILEVRHENGGLCRSAESWTEKWGVTIRSAMSHSNDPPSSQTTILV